MTGIIVRGGTVLENPNPPYPGITTIPFPECPPVTVTRTGSQTTGVVQNATDETWDLTGAVWDCVNVFETTDPFPEPLNSPKLVRSCMIGGTVLGPISDLATRDQWYRNLDGGPRKGGDGVTATLDVNTQDNWLVIRDMEITRFEDLYDFQASRETRQQDQVVYIDHCYGEFGRDDSFELEGGATVPDGPCSLHINNSYFQSFTGYAFRPPGAVTAQNGQGASTFTVENSLLWIVPMRLTDTDCGPTQVARGRCVTTVDPDIFLGTYGIWKWSNMAPRRVAVRNCIFRLDMPSYSSCQSQKWPDAVYDNVTLVWTGAGDYFTAGDCVNVLPPGVNFTTDITVWDDAVAAWSTQ